ncbi:MAG: hypothetical protein RL021_76 [Bacteroidota bacterium]|jgi:chorismate dehydratase
MNEKIRVSIVSYLNSAPFLFGLRNHAIRDRIELFQDVPAVCAEKLRSGQVDIGLIPVATLPEIPNGTIIGDFCIGCDGEVHSVLLLSRVPLHEIDRVLLDYQSRTSVRLVRILAEELWKIAPEWTPALPGYEKSITGRTAAVVIGDRAMEMRADYPFIYDLGAAWKELTGLPFVFAVWTANRMIDSEFMALFNEALGEGLSAIPEILKNLRPHPVQLKELDVYLRQHIRYAFYEEQRKGLELFLSKL